MKNNKEKKKINKYETVRITANVDADGDVYVKGKNGNYYYIGYLEDDDNRITEVPNHLYKKIKRIIKK